MVIREKLFLRNNCLMLWRRLDKKYIETIIQPTMKKAGMLLRWLDVTLRPVKSCFSYMMSSLLILTLKNIEDKIFSVHVEKKTQKDIF